MSKDDGGPAFMTLRDYFAAAALTGWIAGPCGGDVLSEYDANDNAFMEHQSEVAKTCYAYADAMLKAREA